MNASLKIVRQSSIFDRVQINEVTSKFVGGHVGILIVPKRPMNFGTSLESLPMRNSVRIEDIKPLLIPKLVVKCSQKKTCDNVGKKIYWN